MPTRRHDAWVVLLVFIVLAPGCEALALSKARTNMAAAVGGTITYFAAGEDFDGSASAVVDYIDWAVQPATVHQLQPMNFPRKDAAAAFAAGNLVVGGGYDTNYVFEVERWDGNQWVTLVDTLSEGRSLLAAAAAGGIIVFAGGSSPTSAVDVFSTSSWRLIRTSNLPQACWGLGALAISNTIYLFGGLIVSPSVASYSTNSKVAADGTITATFPLPAGRGDLAAAALGNTLVIYGGVDSTTKVNTGVWLTLDVTTGVGVSWTIGFDITDAAGGAANGYAVFAGGRQNDVAQNDAYLFNGTQWSAINPGLSVARRDHSALTVGNLVVFAGGSTDVAPSAVIDVFDTSTLTTVVRTRRPR